MELISFTECSNGKLCLVCDRNFTSNLHCKTHVKASKVDRTFECRYCCKKFKQKDCHQTFKQKSKTKKFKQKS